MGNTHSKCQYMQTTKWNNGSIQYVRPLDISKINSLPLSEIMPVYYLLSYVFKYREELMWRDGNVSGLERIQQDSDRDPIFLRWIQTRPKSIGSKNLNPYPDPLGPKGPKGPGSKISWNRSLNFFSQYIIFFTYNMILALNSIISTKWSNKIITQENTT